MRRPIRSVICFLYGEMSDAELGQCAALSLVLCLVVGAYWLMRSIKDSVFATVVGLEYQPRAKMLSLFVATAELLLYGVLVERLDRRQLLVVVFSFYAVAFLASAACLASPTIGLYDAYGTPLPASPWRLVGWLLYFTIESFGTFSVSLFWQLTNSQLSLEAAKMQCAPACNAAHACLRCIPPSAQARRSAPACAGMG